MLDLIASGFAEVPVLGSAGFVHGLLGEPAVMGFVGYAQRLISAVSHDPGDSSSKPDHSPEAALREGTKPSPTATTDPRQNRAGSAKNREQP